MATRIVVRPLEAGDYRRLRSIEKEIVREYLQYLARTGERDTITSSATPSYVRHYSKMGCSFVAELDGTVVGYILSKPISYANGGRKMLWLEYIAVLQRHRRFGIGSRLLREVVGWARKHGCEAIYATLNPNNRESSGLLAKQGFRVKKWMVAERRPGLDAGRTSRARTR